MGEPSASCAAALIAERDAEIGQVVVVCEDHASFSGCDLLVGIEGENAHCAEDADFFVADLRAGPFATVFDHGQVVLGCDVADGIEASGIAEDHDGEDGLCPVGDLLLDGGWVDVEGDGVYVNEDGFCASHHDRGGGCDERKRGGDDLVSRPQPQGLGAEEETACAAVDGDGPLSADVLGECLLELA